MNVCLNLVKAFLVLGIRNDLDWLLRFLALEVFDFFAWINFLDLVVFWPFDWLLQLIYPGYTSFFLSQFST